MIFKRHPDDCFPNGICLYSLNTIIKIKLKASMANISNLLFLLEANIDMRFILSSLLVQTFQNFVGIGIHIKVHLLVIVLEELGWIIVQKIVYLVV